MNREAHPSRSDVPSCPECGTLMVLRTARKGRNAGEKFWGCARFPDCKGTRPVSPDTDGSGGDPTPTRDEIPSPPESSSVSSPLPVAWIEGTWRSDFIPEYVSVGAMPGVVHDRLGEQSTLERLLTQCLFLYRRARSRQNATQHAQLVSALLGKILQRGRTPLPTLEVEREALRLYGFLESARDLSVDGIEMGWELQEAVAARVNAEGVLAAIAERCPFSLDPGFTINAGSHALLQSSEETWFLDQWVPNVLGTSAAHWFTPQASLDKLLEAGGIEVEDSGARRIDFLFFHPGSRPLGIEIDGEEHTSADLVDRARDQSLEKIGIDVLRITHHEINHGGGVALDRLKSRCEESLTALEHSDDDERIAGFLIDCSNAAKVQFAIARAIGWGWLTAGQQWNIDLAGPNSYMVSASGVLDLLRLLSAFDVLYGDNSTPKCCTVRGDNGLSIAWCMGDDGNWQEQEIVPPKVRSDVDYVRITVESRTSPYHDMNLLQQSDIIVRPAFLPVEFATPQSGDLGRQEIVPVTYDKANTVLTSFLHTVFRKYRFRSMQGEAIYNTLRKKDCVVLLPTGAGKSLIYQLAGLLMPGVTIVVDPLVSLIEDQVEGLHSYGIDRAAPIARGFSSLRELKHLLRSVERGEYHFVLLSPERMQSPHFRSTLRALAETTLVNLAVIDEAHCVSEWGHDFRPAYLNLGNNLRRFGTDRDGTPPPLLALTGTASRAVLRDLLVDLGIDRNRSDALIRPESFDRSELRFEIVRTRPPEDANAALRGVLNSLPAKFGLPRTELFRSSGRHTASGIVFVPTVNARIFGLLDASTTVRKATNASVTIYSGSPPKAIEARTWDSDKKTNANDFKRNHVPILVATNAFGMGIDKPNIRFTVHFGMPGSLESFYQEAGRAGRDRKPARCIIVFSEYDPGRSDTLLDPDLNLPELRNRFESVNRNRKMGDDVTRALWFHLQGFHGAQEEIEEIKQRLSELGSLSSRNTIELPFGEEERKSKEKGLYRLLRIGVISDYEVDFGSRKFLATVEPFDFENCKKRLLDYIYAAQPAKSTLLAHRLDTILPNDSHHGAYELARVLVEFIYDVVERSRRRMIQESVLLARRAQNDGDIRARLLDYLQEGLGAERIGQLLDEPEIALLDWCELVDKCQTPMDAGELRGLCIRALETYPDHPGLLLCRAVSEAMCSDHDDGVSSQGIGAAIRGSIVGYGLSRIDVEMVLERLFELALTRVRELGVALIVALLGLDDSRPEFSFAINLGLAKAREFDDDRALAAMVSYRIRKLTGDLESAMSRLNSRYETKGVMQALDRRGTA